MRHARSILMILWLSLSLVSVAPAGFCDANRNPEKPDDFFDPTLDTTSVDENFLMAAAQMNASEVVLSRVAAQESDKARVRQYAKQIIRDHTKASRQLNRLAEREDVQVSNKPDPLHIVATQNLLSLNGRALDREYAAQMVLDHEEAIRLFRTEIRIGSNPQVREYARLQLPILREHLRRAERLSVTF